MFYMNRQRKVFVRLWGGLGNQLFQYAAGLQLTKAHDAELILDDIQCRLDVNRPYALNHFMISGRLLPDEERGHLERWVRLTRPIDAKTRGVTRLTKRLLVPALRGCFAYIEDAREGYASEFTGLRGAVYLAGTWADERYFLPVADDVRREFTFREPPSDRNAELLREIADGPAVAVHVRRGDYVSTSYGSNLLGACGVAYYERAWAHVPSDARYFVFSDDPEWAAANLKPPGPTRVIDHNQGAASIEDLRLMSACRHFIIANSTFSWWGAWLGERPDSVVVAPDPWFADPSRKADPVPDRWVREGRNDGMISCT